MPTEVFIQPAMKDMALDFTTVAEPEVLPNKSEMQRHAKDIHKMDQKAHKCVKCFKSFPTSQQLQQHSLVHTGIRKYNCHYCEKSFKQLSHVQQHHRRHTGERPYKCSLEGCQKSFAQLSNLQWHLRNHDNQVQKAQSDRKPYQCSVCDRRFATESSLHNHVTKIHVPLSTCPTTPSPPPGVSTSPQPMAKAPAETSCAPTLHTMSAADRSASQKLREISKRDLELLRMSRMNLYDFPSQVPPALLSMYLSHIPPGPPLAGLAGPPTPTHN